MPRKEIYIKACAHCRLEIAAAAEEVKVYRNTLRRSGFFIRRKWARNKYMVLDTSGQGLTDYMSLEELRKYMRSFRQK